MIPSRKFEVQYYSEIEKTGIERSLLFILFQHYFNFCVFSSIVVTAYSYTYATVLLGRLLDLTKPSFTSLKIHVILSYAE